MLVNEVCEVVDRVQDPASSRPRCRDSARRVPATRVGSGKAMRDPARDAETNSRDCYHGETIVSLALLFGSFRRERDETISPNAWATKGLQ